MEIPPEAFINRSEFLNYCSLNYPTCFPLWGEWLLRACEQKTREVLRKKYCERFYNSNFDLYRLDFHFIPSSHFPHRGKQEDERVKCVRRQMLSEAVGDDAHAELLKMLAFLRTWRPEKRKQYLPCGKLFSCFPLWGKCQRS